MFEFDPSFEAKLEYLREQGINPYPNDFPNPQSLAGIRHIYGDIEISEDMGQVAGDFCVGGRVIYRNRMGKILFFRIQDQDDRIQIMAVRPEVGDAEFQRINATDIGDWIWVSGPIMKTKAGELTIRVNQFRLASKIITPFPDRWNGIQDSEAKTRQRYLDLMINPGSRDIFIRRAKIIQAIRQELEICDFIEVDTGILQTLAGGANAKPFTTHHNALDLDLYLRIAPELGLKRLLVGGFEKVFEIGKNFRNEGLSPRHIQEFASVEWYEAWANYQDGMEMVESIFERIFILLRLDREIEYLSQKIDFGDTERWSRFQRISFTQLIAQTTELDDIRNVSVLQDWCRERFPGRELPETFGRLWELIFDECIQLTLISPTFVYDFPIEISPLSRASDLDPEIAERFELYIAGQEIANGFSELNDPIEQARRFEEQAKRKAAGDDEAMFFDADYITALTYAMPPACGVGIGIDRVVAILNNCQSIKEVVLFPILGTRKE